MDHRMVSLADQVFEQLETEVLSGAYQVDELLTESRLSEKMQVSRTPIRDALHRLEQEHLVRLSSKGAVVVGISRQDLASIYEVRMRLEGLAARKAAAHRNESALADMQHTLELQGFYTDRGDPDGIHSMDDHFHEVLYRNCGDRVLENVLMPLHRKLLKYRRASLSGKPRAENALDEHRAIYEAIRDGDEDRAERLTLQHVANARDHILAEVD